MLRVGQKVVCINNLPRYEGGIMDGLTEGQVYTIRELVSNHSSIRFPTPENCVKLEEIIRPSKTPQSEIPYLARRFRPVTDISIFTKMLEPKKRKAKV